MRSVMSVGRLFSLCLLNQMTCDLSLFAYVWVMSIACRGLEGQKFDTQLSVELSMPIKALTCLMSTVLIDIDADYHPQCMDEI